MAPSVWSERSVLESWLGCDSSARDAKVFSICSRFILVRRAGQGFPKRLLRKELIDEGQANS